MNYLNFKNKVNQIDQNMFDSQTRICYNNLNFVNKLINKVNHNNEYESPFSIFNRNSNDKKLINLFDSLKSCNFLKAKYICKKSFNYRL